MSARIRCTTTFDITATQEKGRPRADDLAANRRRNQQRNWDTLNQLLSLRTLPENVTDPVYDNQARTWSFAFDIPDISAITDHVTMDLLLKDCHGVPMITGLDESADHAAVISTSQPGANLWFELEAAK
jgi:hypothetical protein